MDALAVASAAAGVFILFLWGLPVILRWVDRFLSRMNKEDKWP